MNFIDTVTSLAALIALPSFMNVCKTLPVNSTIKENVANNKQAGAKRQKLSEVTEEVVSQESPVKDRTAQSFILHIQVGRAL